MEPTDTEMLHWLLRQIDVRWNGEYYTFQFSSIYDPQGGDQLEIGRRHQDVRLAIKHEREGS